MKNARSGLLVIEALMFPSLPTILCVLSICSMAPFTHSSPLLSWTQYWEDYKLVHPLERNIGNAYRNYKCAPIQLPHLGKVSHGFFCTCMKGHSLKIPMNSWENMEKKEAGSYGFIWSALKFSCQVQKLRCKQYRYHSYHLDKNGEIRIHIHIYLFILYIKKNLEGRVKMRPRMEGAFPLLTFTCVWGLTQVYVFPLKEVIKIA